MRVCGSSFLLVSIALTGAIGSAAHAQSSILQTAVAKAFSSGPIPASVTLSGQGTWTAGSQHDSGLLELKALADGHVDETWSFGTISHSVSQDALGPARTCKYVTADSKESPFLGPNCVRALPWFAPWTATMAPTDKLAVADTTTPADASQGLRRLTYAPVLTQLSDTTVSDTVKRLQRDGVMTILYDAQTWLPQRLEYKQATDIDELRFLDVSVSFSDYRLEAGCMIPHHLQKYVQRTLQLDYIVNSVSIQ